MQATGYETAAAILVQAAAENNHTLKHVMASAGDPRSLADNLRPWYQEVLVMVIETQRSKQG